MSDYLMNLSSNDTARAVIRGLGLPVPLPQPLERPNTAWPARPLDGRPVFLGGAPGGTLLAPAAAALAEAGAALHIAAPEGAAELPQAEALDVAAPPDTVRPHALVFDASGLTTPERLRALYDFFHTTIKGTAPNARVVVLGRPVDEAGDDPLLRATRRALEGFTRSVGKEVGRKGATAQCIYVAEGAEPRLAPVLRWFTSARSAYVSGQAVAVGNLIAEAATPVYAQPLAGKVALVTGAARGIGEATARTLAREGARVIVMDRPAELEAAQQVARNIQGTALGCDITDAQAAQTILDTAGPLGGLDVVVHNAGVTRDKTLGNMSGDAWDLVLNVNLAGLIRCNEALVPHLKIGARIVALASIGGIAGNVGQTNYAATKAGVIGYVQGLAPQVAGRGIAVNAVAPGFIETQMTAAIPFGTREVGRRLCSLSQGGQPLDVAETICFLASPGAAGLSGTVLRVCGQSFIGA